MAERREYVQGAAVRDRGAVRDTGGIHIRGNGNGSILVIVSEGGSIMAAAAQPTPSFGSGFATPAPAMQSMVEGTRAASVGPSDYRSGSK